MSSSFAVSAIGRDRPGIVAAVSKVLFELGCNVEDSSMTLLRGNFVMTLIVSAPTGVSAGRLHDELRAGSTDIDLTFAVLDVDDRASVPTPTHVLTVYGGDKPGIMYRTTKLLAEAGANITDVNSRLVGDEDAVYALILEVDIPADARSLESALRESAASTGVDITLHAYDADVL